MGLAAISDRLADRLVPGMRNRMLRPRFVTAVAVGCLAYEGLEAIEPDDGISTPPICFEWIVIEGFVRRLGTEVPTGTPGSQKARRVVRTDQRLSAATYLKGPSVFGFNGVYKPFAVDADIVDDEYGPGPRCVELVRSWEGEQGYAGYADSTPGSEGVRLRAQLRDEVAQALRQGHCATPPRSWLFGKLAEALNPERSGPGERRTLRSLIVSEAHPTRAELARLMDTLSPDLSEKEVLAAIRKRCSEHLGRIVDAITAYEEFALLVDSSFRTMCAVSYGQGMQPITPNNLAAHETIVLCARELPEHYYRAADAMAAVDASMDFEIRMGEFASKHSPSGLVELLMAHHERIQGDKPPNGKSPWFDPVRDGWVVRQPYGSPEQPLLDGGWVHPIRVAAVRRFLSDTAP